MLLLRNINEPLYVIFKFKTMGFYKVPTKKHKKLKLNYILVWKHQFLFKSINCTQYTQVENVKFWYFSFLFSKIDMLQISLVKSWNVSVKKSFADGKWS